MCHRVLDAGPHSAEWDGRDDRGARVASGPYIYRLRHDQEEIERVTELAGNVWGWDLAGGTLAYVESALHEPGTLYARPADEDSVAVEPDDEEPLVPGSTYYVAFLHQNCPDTEVQISAEISPNLYAGDAGLGDDEPKEGCGCQTSGNGTPLLLSLLLLAVAASLGFAAESADPPWRQAEMAGILLEPAHAEIDVLDGRGELRLGRGSEIEGELKNPAEFYFQHRPPEKFDSLVKIRKHFHREMLRDAVMTK